MIYPMINKNAFHLDCVEPSLLSFALWAGLPEEQKFHVDLDWLAGLIDGAGCFFQRYNAPKHNGFHPAHLDILLPIVDKNLLQIVQANFGGSLKSRAGGHSIRYRLQGKGLFSMMRLLNGRHQNVVRQEQWQLLMNDYDFHYDAKPFSWDSGYMAGLFDGNGNIQIEVKKTKERYLNLPGKQGKISRLQHGLETQLIISITEKRLENIDFLKHKQDQLFGQVQIDKRQNNRYTWSVEQYEQQMQLLLYFQSYASHSVKADRLALVKSYYDCFRNKEDKLNIEKRKYFAKLWFKHNI